MRLTTVTVAAAATLIWCPVSGAAQAPRMSFFITSAGPGKGADVGGLEGADRHCKQLAEAAGVAGASWHAYLSTTAANGHAAVNARDRIGKGPWYNAKGVAVAQSVADLHSENNKLGKENSLTEMAWWSMVAATRRTRTIS